MSKRVNKRFVTVLVGALILLSLLALYAIYLLQNRPEQQRARAQELLKQGKVAEALDHYELALGKRPNDFELVTEFIQALKQFRTSDGMVARNRLRQLNAATLQARSLRPTDPQAFQDLMQLNMRLAESFPSIDQWNAFRDLVSSLISGMAPDNPNQPLAHKYRGIAQVHRIQALDLPLPEREAAKQDLLEAQKAFPDDGELISYLAWWHVLAARDAERAGGRASEVAALRDQAAQLTQTYLDQHPQDLQAQLWHARILSSIDRRDQAEGLLQKLQDAMMQDPPTIDMAVQVASLLVIIDQTPVQESPDLPAVNRGRIRATDVILAAARKWPQDLQLAVHLGRLYRSRGDAANALAAFKFAREQQGETEIMSAVVIDGLKTTATFYYADMLLTEAVQGADEQTRQAALQTAQPVVAEYLKLSPDTPQAKLLSGKLALIEGKPAEAVKLLEESSAALEDTDLQTLLLVAGASQQLGQYGEAIRRLERVLALSPSLADPRVSLVRLYFQTRQLDKAQQHIDVLLKNESKRALALRLQAYLHVQNQRYDDAIAIYQSLDPQNDRAALLSLAQCYILADRPRQAQELLKPAFDAKPSDTSILQLLLQATTDPAEVAAIAKKAQDAGVPQAAIQVLLARGKDPAQMTEALEQFLAEKKEEDPLRYHLSRYQLLFQQDKKDEAAAELAQAAQLDPNHPLVVQELFKQALMAKDWTRAEQLANQAAQLNLDRAQGQFFFGQMHGARGDAAQAAAAFRQALEARPVYSDGWLMLGEALRQTGDLEAARDAYQRATTQQPTNTRAWTGLAAVAAARGEGPLAVQAMEQALRFGGDTVELRLQYLAVLEQFGDKQQALAQRRELAEKNPQLYENRLALALLQANLGDAAAAEATLQQVFAEQGKTRQNVAVAARIYAGTNQMLKARDLLQSYIQDLGDKAQTEDWMLVGQFFVQIRALQPAAMAFQNAMKLEDPQTRPASRQFADILFGLRMYPEAAEIYQRLGQQYPDDRRVQLRLAEALARAGKLDEAQAIVDRFVKVTGQDTSTLLLSATLDQSRAARAAAEGDRARASELRQKALQNYNRAVELSPKLATAYYYRATLLQSEPQDEPAAIADLNQALRLEPNLALARQLLASIHLRHQQLGEARRELRALLERDPTNAAARVELARLLWSENLFSDLQALLDQSATLLPGDPTWPRLKAQLALSQNKTQDAIRFMSQAFELQPDASSLGELVDLLLRYQEYSLALKALQEQQSLVAGQPLLEAMAGQVWAAQGQTQQAQQAFTRALELSLDLPLMTVVAQRMTAAFGLDQTLRDLEAWTANTPRAANAQFALAQLELQNQRPAAAAQRLSNLLSNTPPGSRLRTPARNLLAMALSADNRPRDAVDVLRQSLQESPDDPEALNNLAFILTDQLNQASDALPHAQKAARLAPGNPSILDTLGWAQFRAGQVQDALATLQQAAALTPSAYTSYHLAMVLSQLQQPQDALKQLQTAKTLADQNQDHALLQKIQDQLQVLGGADQR